MRIYKAVLDPVIECVRNGPRTPTEEKPMGVTLDAMFHLHAGMVTLMRLTGSDDLMERLRPGMTSYADDPDFRRALALVGIESGLPHVNPTPELYGRLIDLHADRILRQARAA